MDLWAPSFLSAKKIIASFSLVCFALSIPVFYLLTERYIEFKNNFQSTVLEIKGSHVISGLLKDLSTLSYTDTHVVFESGKKEIHEELVTKNILNLRTESLREVERIFHEKKYSSSQFLAQNYYRALIRFVANHSNLILDPDLDSYYFMDILIFRLPRIYLLLSNHNKEAFDLRLLENLYTELSEIDYSLQTAINENKRRSFRTHYNLSHMDNYTSIVKEVDAQFSGVKRIDRKEITQKIQIFENDIAQDLHGILLNRNHLLKRDKNFVLMLTLGFLFFGIISGYFLFVKILKNHAEMFKRYTYQSKQLEESEKLSFVGEIASSIAHEVKNPLTIIDFIAAAVRKDLNSEHFDKVRAFTRLTKISEMTSRINKISNLLTVFTRKSYDDPFENISLKKILEEAVYLTQLKASAVGIIIQVIPFECELCCRTIQLEQVFINLINNAIDAVGLLNEKWIKIIPSRIEKEGEEWIVVRVVDSGTGINKEVANNIFNSFFTTKPSGKGTGLGLSIASRIIEDHRGKFYYDERAQHTTFVVEIPRLRAAP